VLPIIITFIVDSMSGFAAILPDRYENYELIDYLAASSQYEYSRGMAGIGLPFAIKRLCLHGIHSNAEPNLQPVMRQYAYFEKTHQTKIYTSRYKPFYALKTGHNEPRKKTVEKAYAR